MPPDARSRVRLLAASTREAGAWLNALPISSLGLRMTRSGWLLVSALVLPFAGPMCVPTVEQRLIVWPHTVSAVGAKHDEKVRWDSWINSVQFLCTFRMMILLCIHYQILAVGVEVLVENTKHKLRKGGKLEPAFLWPYTISRHVGKGVYELKNQKGE